MLLSKLRADLSDLLVVAGDGEHELGRASVRRGPERRTRDGPRRLVVRLAVEDAPGEIGLHVQRGLGVHQGVAQRVLRQVLLGPPKSGAAGHPDLLAGVLALVHHRLDDVEVGRERPRGVEAGAREDRVDAQSSCPPKVRPRGFNV